MGKIEKYEMRLDNSLCDIVELRTPNNVWELDQKTPKSDDWKRKVFQKRQGVLVSHANPNDEEDRMVYVFIDAEKETDSITQHEVDWSDFKMNPKKFADLIVNHNYRRHFICTRLDNLVYDYPNLVKRSKILIDGKTHCLVKNLSDLLIAPQIKERLSEYDYQNHQSAIPEMVKIGLVTTNLYLFDLFPVEVKFPNGFCGRFNCSDLVFYHETED